MKRRVVITGVGAVTPLGVGAEPLLRRWAAGESGIVDGEGACRDYVAKEHLSVKEARRADRFAQLAMVASDEALAQAGWNGEKPYASERIGCILASGIGGLESLEGQHDNLRDRGEKAVSPLSVPLFMVNAAAAALSMRHGLRGPSFQVGSACAAGSHAIGTAFRTIQMGDADAVVTGGAEATLTPLARASFMAASAMSPTGISRPFDARRDGFVMGEGAGVLVIEDREKALERGATILGEIRGYSTTSDAYHITATHPDGTYAAAAMRGALAEAGVTPEQIDYVNAHGTSTSLNDAAETVAIKAVFGDAANDVPISSTKSSIGHLLGAAGAVEAIATVLAMNARTIPPTLGLEEPDPDLDLDYVPLTSRELTPRNGTPIALSNSFGFGGHNVVLCLEGASA
ncbi:beta-ketoacyl-[acyl-carrier-protein] synthase family protein [Conexibacter woesei]|uniref:3-oxoacyl-[acyl-carrier-protein] synthase 2 n=1 Tax=Conexibacter woesei (strain DSM 14684 / CCUG 47730 / CIP 108061 / JCM 11494 / NBRC 100937 / ID131577) TaxID=469383 RepID=D3F5M4_CONWI|nr:beta-ketoacyl-ACP synthase II [Conexibacter woesei]ADB52573.1 3-oxoacyl-(acyl-carrier-protein) synthase 2 [Conexibacter woesei DSM 14684]